MTLKEFKEQCINYYKQYNYINIRFEKHPDKDYTEYLISEKRNWLYDCNIYIIKNIKFEYEDYWNNITRTYDISLLNKNELYNLLKQAYDSTPEPIEEIIL
jgi:hypothetical protein